MDPYLVAELEHMVSALGRPTKGSQMDLGWIATQSQSCTSGASSPSLVPSDAVEDSLDSSQDGNRSALLDDLAFKIEESSTATANLLNDVKDRWTSYDVRKLSAFQRLRAIIETRVTVERLDHDSLSEEEKNLFHALLQTSAFIFFLGSQNQQAAVYGDKAASLTDLTGRLQQVICAVRQLLAHLNDDTIFTFIQEYDLPPLNLSHVGLNGSGPTAAVKRIICTLVLEQIDTFLKDILDHFRH